MLVKGPVIQNQCAISPSEILVQCIGRNEAAVTEPTGASLSLTDTAL